MRNVPFLSCCHFFEGGGAEDAHQGARGVPRVREEPAEGLRQGPPPPPQPQRVSHHGGLDPAQQVPTGGVWGWPIRTQDARA